MENRTSKFEGNTTRTRGRLLLDTLLLIAVITLSITGLRQPQSAVEPNIDRADRPAGGPPGQVRYPLVIAKDQGDFKLSYEPRKGSKKGIANRRVSTNLQGIECIIDSLNERLALPFDIVVDFKECHTPDAFYDDVTHRITFCYDLIDEYSDLFSIKIRNQAELDDAVRGAVAFTFFHEMGHALVEIWNLPITGKREDAADQISTLILIEETEEGEEMALDGALSFMIYAGLFEREEKAYWDEHSLDEQRFYDTLCMLYGHDPKKYAYLIEDGTLPVERAELCKDDYAKFRNSWQTLLAPYVKTPPEAASKIRMR